MTTIKRKSRRRITDRQPLFTAWQAGQPPPAWASEPGEAHHDEILGLYFFNDHDNQLDARTHPHRKEWAEAMRASTPLPDTAHA